MRAIKKEYFVKVPANEALRFKGLLIMCTDAIPLREVAAIVEKCRIGRIALLKLGTEVGMSNSRMRAKDRDIESIRDELSVRLSKKKGLMYQTKVFMHERSAVGDATSGSVLGDKMSIKKCLEWLSD